MQIKWSPTALEELQNIFDYYEPISPQAGDKIFQKIEDKLEYIKEFPRMARKGLVKNTYEAVVIKTGYFIIYRLQPDQEKPKTIYIASILNGRQNR